MPTNRAVRRTKKCAAISIETDLTKNNGRRKLSDQLWRYAGIVPPPAIETRPAPWCAARVPAGLTGEYSMLPRATHNRGSREAARGQAVREERRKSSGFIGPLFCARR